MKKILSILTTFIVFIVLNSCSKDFLDLKPKDQFSEEVVWSDLALIGTFANNIYFNLYQGFDGKIGMQMLCDEAMRVADRGAVNVCRSLVSPSDYSVFRTQVGQRKLVWDHLYKQIRACNLFLSKTQENTYVDEDLKNRLIGEVHFLRAYNYYILVIQYGGIPIIDQPYNLGDDLLVARNTLEESINFVVEECDRAAALLPIKHTSLLYGRATKGAALALKSKMLLYAASELCHNSSWAIGYTNPELISYTDGNRSDAWMAAKNAAKAVINLDVYSLHKEDPLPGDDITENYREIFIQKKTAEDIFVRQFTVINMRAEYYHPGLHSGPNGYYADGSNNPIGKAVDDFEMSDGSKFDWSNQDHKISPYENREPRFYAYILYDGTIWRKRPTGVDILDPIGIVQTGFYKNPNGTWRGGLDTRKSPIADWNGTGSGYYEKKFIDPSYPFNLYDMAQESPWRLIRYTEILLNYAEACNELGEDDEARIYLNKIRKRAGLPDINTSGIQLRENIRHERRVELMFEGQRYWDIRRWMISPQVMVDVTGIDIRYYIGQDKPIYTPIPIQTRRWLDKSYFMPILLDEMNKNELLIQNPLY